jgi:hypothetical protein
MMGGFYDTKNQKFSARRSFCWVVFVYRLSAKLSIFRANVVDRLPHNNMAFDMQMITIISHSNDPGGLSEVEVSANGTVIQLHAASGTFAKNYN